MITSYNDYKLEYKKDKYAVWIKVCLSNGVDYYFKDYNDWAKIKSICNNDNLTIKKMSLKYKSHIEYIDLQDIDGVYFIRSVLGSMGEKTKQTFTIGKIKKNDVEKQIWVIPELINHSNSSCKIEDCFPEALITYEKARTI